MSGLTLFTFVLVALSCYSLSSSSKVVRNVQQQHQATKKVDLANRQKSPEHFTAEHQISHAAQQLNVENRKKRSQRDIGEYKDLNDIIEDLEDNTLAVQAAAVTTGLPAEFDLENMPPLTYYLLLQKLKQLQSNEPTYRVRTPRLGRSIDFQLDGDSNGANMAAYLSGGGVAGGIDDDQNKVTSLHNRQQQQQQFITRLMKKSVPFKPRLGKRTQVCD